MIAALADAGAALGREDYLDAARACAGFVLGLDARRRRPPAAHLQGRQAHLNAYLEDHAFLLEALLTLYEATFEARWFDEARELAETMIERFGDPERGGFFSTSDDHEELIARRKEVGDHPIPSGNTPRRCGLLRLAALTGERALRGAGRRACCASSPGRPPATPTPSPTCSGRSTSTSPRPARSPSSAERTSARRLAELVRGVRSAHRPHVVLAGGPEGTERPELLARAHRRRRPARRLRLRALHLPGPGHRPAS